MKRLITTLAFCAAFTLTSCVQFEKDRLPVQTATEAPELSVSVTSDNGISISLVPAKNTGYFSYAVMEGEATKLSAASLLSDKYKADAVASGVEEFNAYRPAFEVEVGKLSPYTIYTVYAVASSTTGVVAEIVSKTVRTSDSTAPEVVGYDSGLDDDGNLVFLVSFDEEISLAGNGRANAVFYALNAADEAWKTVALDASLFEAEGTDVSFIVPAEELIPGAFVFLTFSDGVVKNASELENEPWDEVIFEVGEEEVEIGGIVDRVAMQKWAFSFPEGQEAVTKFVDYKTLEMKQVAGTDYDFGETASAEVSLSTVSNGRTVSYTPVFGKISATEVAVYLSEAPSFGSTVNYTIAEGSYEDVFGNLNQEFVADGAYFCSYGYTIDDVVGTYQNSGKSVFTGYDEDSWTFTVVPSDNPEKGNVMLTSYYGFPCKVYAKWDGDFGELSLSPEKTFLYAYMRDIDGTLYEYRFFLWGYYAWQDEEPEDIKLAMPEKGVFEDGNDYIGYWYDVYSPDGARVFYDYNFFLPQFMAVEPEEAQSAPRKLGVPAFGSPQKKVFNKK